MSSTEDERPSLCQLSRDSTGFFQPDPIVPWLGLEYGGICDWQRLESPETGVCAEIGMRRNCGEAANCGVQGFHLSPPCFRNGKTWRSSDLLFSLDRRFDPGESIVELLRQTGKLPKRSQLLQRAPKR